jgi:hypothetical protein
MGINKKKSVIGSMAIINRTTKKIWQIEVFGFGDQKLVIENIWLPSSSIRKLGD